MTSLFSIINQDNIQSFNFFKLTCPTVNYMSTFVEFLFQLSDPRKGFEPLSLT